MNDKITIDRPILETLITGCEKFASVLKEVTDECGKDGEYDDAKKAISMARKLIVATIQAREALS